MEQIKFVNNKIYTGIVNHTRFTPFHHNFSYKVTYFWFCINTFKNYIFFKRNKISLFSFFDKDHCNVHKKDKLESFFYKKIKKYHKTDIYKINVLCIPRIFGYNFNPISIFIIYDFKEQPHGIMLEVNNTFKEKHLYYSKIKKNQTIFKFDKEFYVSPFFSVEGNYNVRFKIDKEKILLKILYSIEEKNIFVASYIGKSENMSDKNLFKRFLMVLSQNIKVTLGIYIQALKLFFKGAKYINRPNFSKTKLTVINDRK